MNDLDHNLPIALQPAPFDAAAICHRLAGYEFPWELNRAFEIAVLKTFCVPRISRLLRQTGEFEQRTQKRYDDTGLILGNILKWGYDSPRGQAAIAQMNRIHQRFDIANKDFLYVLSTLIYEPIRWNQHFGWRPFTADEKLALFVFWRAVGQQMGLSHIPQTFEAFQQFNRAYEAQYFQYHHDNQVIGNAVVGLMQSWGPAIAAPLMPMLLRAVADQPMRQALGWRQPAPVLTQLAHWILRVKQWWVRRLPRRKNPAFAIDHPNRTYPDGYQLNQLGPAPVATNVSRCPFMRMQALLKGEFS